MPGPKGNKHAEKWGETEALKFVNQVLEEVEGNEKIVYFLEPVINAGQYKDVWHYLKNKFKDNEESDVFLTIKKVEAICESRLFNSAFDRTKAKSETMAIFALKNNHNWKDKQEIDQTLQVKEIDVNVKIIE